MTTKTPARYYWRCTLCLSISVTEGRIAGVCGFCEKPLECMGRVKSTRLVWDTREVPCDARCTNAPGPNCDCSCGGANHGSQRTVAVTVDAGALPRIPVIDAALAAKRVAEYEAAKADARARFDAAFPGAYAARAAGEWVSAPAFDGLRWFTEAKSRAHRARSHAGRIKALNAFQPQRKAA